MNVPTETSHDPGSEGSLAAHRLPKLYYANQTVFIKDGVVRASHRNFVDLLAVLLDRDETSRLVLPIVDAPAEGNGFELGIPPHRVLTLPGYQGHFGALWGTITSSLKVRRELLQLRRLGGGRAVFLSTVPSSMFSVQAILKPSGVRLVGVARGDTRETLRRIYGRSMRGFLAKILVNCFLRTARWRQRRGDLLMFGVGGEVIRSLGLEGGPTTAVFPLLHANEMPVGAKAAPPIDRPVRFLMLGRLSEEKSVRELLEAARILISEGRDFRLTIAGFGTLDSVIRSAIEKGLGSHVEFIGSVEPGRAVYERLIENDVVILPSRTEGVPRVLAEAAASGRLLLATPVGSIPQAFGDGVRYIESADPEDIAEAMRWAISTPDAWGEFIDQAIEAARRMTIESAAAEILCRVDEWASASGGGVE